MPEYKDLMVPAVPTCGCMELGAQICVDYEGWCSEAESIEWYNSMSQEERHVLAMENAVHGFARGYRAIFAADLLF